MRVLVTGSRDWPSYPIIDQVLSALPRDGLVIVHGACPTGADAMADQWAAAHGVSVERHPAQWGTFGRAAGPMRNEEMVAAGAEECLAFIRNYSRGAQHTVFIAQNAGMPTRIWRFYDA